MPPLRPRRRRAAGLVGLAAGLCALACSPSDPPPPRGAREAAESTPSAVPGLPAPGSAAGRSLLLVTLDTTRADRLGCYGAAGAETPHLDGLAARGLLFRDAVSPVPMTLPAHASLMTGLDPPRHGVRSNGEYVLGPEAVTLAETLRAAGYRTAAFVSSFVLDSRFGLGQGFETYDGRLEATRAAAFSPQIERSAGAVTDAAASWLRTHGHGVDPYFLWVHYFDPHDPYEPPEPFRSRFRERLYDGEIAYVDRELGRLLAALEEAGRVADTVIVVAGDHGESLGEHHERYHSRTLYEGAVRVPLLLVPPAPEAASRARPDAGRVDGRVVSLVDLFPTLLDLLGLEIPGKPDGENLLRVPTHEDRIAYLETLNPYLDNGWAPLYGARAHGEKYILAPRPELYDLREDPSEARNRLPGGAAAEARAERLYAFLAAKVRGELDAPPPAPDGDPEVRRRLEALGYVTPGRDRSDPAVAAGARPDPKDVLPLLEELNEGRRLLAAGDAAEAARRARRILARTPLDRSALQLLAEAYARLGNVADAERALRRHLELGPSVGACVLLAQVVLQQGRFEEAEALLDRAEGLEPGHGAVPLARGDLRLAQGRPGDALALYRRAAEVDPYRFAGLARARIRRVEGLVGRP